MTTLRQRMIEDMCLRNFASTTQRSYIHYVAEFAKYFNRSPQELDLEAVRQYQLYLTQERKLSPQSINTFVSAVQFLYLVTLEMPGTSATSRVPAWTRNCPWSWPPTKSNASWSTSRASRTAPCC
jgi:site-specific recombinase XerD